MTQGPLPQLPTGLYWRRSHTTGNLFICKEGAPHTEGAIFRRKFDGAFGWKTRWVSDDVPYFKEEAAIKALCAELGFTSARGERAECSA